MIIVTYVLIVGYEPIFGQYVPLIVEFRQ